MTVIDDERDTPLTVYISRVHPFTVSFGLTSVFDFRLQFFFFTSSRSHIHGSCVLSNSTRWLRCSNQLNGSKGLTHSASQKFGHILKGNKRQFISPHLVSPRHKVAVLIQYMTRSSITNRSFTSCRLHIDPSGQRKGLSHLLNPSRVNMLQAVCGNPKTNFLSQEKTYPTSSN